MANSEKQPWLCGVCKMTHTPNPFWCDKCDTMHSPYECACVQTPAPPTSQPAEAPPMSSPFKPCEICKTPTCWACSDCEINTGTARHVCTKPECRDAHEKAARCNPQPVTGAEPCVRERPEHEAREVGLMKPWHSTAFWAVAMLVLGTLNALAGVGSPGFDYGLAAASSLIWGIEAATKAARQRREDA